MTFDTPLVSIIVPIYNTELYLQDCLDSIAAQTYENIEVILINDGSTDRSKEIAESVCKKDARFKLTNQNNSGVASARQLGLEKACGQFIIHCDSDDLMTKKAIDYLYTSIIKNKSDISVGSYIQQDEMGEKVIKHCSLDKDAFIKSTLTGEYFGSLCNKLIRADVCKDISFEKNINYREDVLFLLKVLRKENVTISITNEVVYFYRKVHNSYTNNITNESIKASLKVTDIICEMFKSKYSKKFLAHVKNRSKVVILLNSNETQRNKFPDSIIYIFFDRKIPLRHKIVVIADVLHFNQTIRLYKFISKKNLKHFI